jgi:hypothetical protein
MTETYTEYRKRVSGLPNFTPLSQEEWETQTQPKSVVLHAEENSKASIECFSSAECEHMQVLAEQAMESDRIRAKAAASSQQGLTAEQQAKNLLNVTPVFSEIDRPSELDVEAELSNAEHMRELAQKALESDQIREAAQTANQ